MTRVYLWTLLFSHVLHVFMTPDLNFSMWKSVHLAYPQAGRQSDRLSAPISCFSSVIQQLDVDPGGCKRNGRWGKTSRMICTSTCMPFLVNVQGIALCHSTRALYGIPAGSVVAQHVRAAVTGETRRHEVAGKQVNEGPEQECSVTSPPDTANFHKSHGRLFIAWFSLWQLLRLQ